MTLREFSEWCHAVRTFDGGANAALKYLAEAADAYHPQTHVETYAFDAITDVARDRLAADRGIT